MMGNRTHLITLAAAIGIVIPFGATTALADHGSSTPSPSTESPKVQDTPDRELEETTPDTDNVQSGDQSGPDTPDAATPLAAPARQ
jgi:hypothetical protein